MAYSQPSAVPAKSMVPATDGEATRPANQPGRRRHRRAPVVALSATRWFPVPTWTSPSATAGAVLTGLRHR
jgi:hypothetical protein